MSTHRSLWLAVCAPAMALADGTLSFVSEPGDPLANGLVYSEDFTDAEVSAFANPYGLRVARVNGLSSWSLNLTSQPGHLFRPACYERAQRDPFMAFGRAGLSFDFSSSGCNTIVARYRVYEFSADPGSGAITDLAVDFVQHCEGAGPALFGALRYDSSIPIDTPPLDPVFTTSGNFHFISDPGDFIGQGQERTFPLDRLVFIAYRNIDNGLSGTFNDTDDLWNIDFAAPDSGPLVPGDYRNAQRYPLQQPGHPGLDYNLDGRGCNTVSGEFDIQQADFEPVDGSPTAVQDTFAQHCEGSGAALTGDMQFTTVFQNGPLLEDVVFIDGLDGVTEWPLTWDCN